MKLLPPITKNAAACLLVLALFFAAAPAHAGGGGGAGRSPGSDHVESIPYSSGGGSGFVLRGSLSELSEVLVSVGGSGRMQVKRAGRNELALVFEGPMAIQLDARALAGSDVRLAYVGPRGGERILERPDGWILLQGLR